MQDDARDAPSRLGEGGTARDRPDEHEALCLRCGRCCHRKMLVGTRVISLEMPCPNLDTESRLCLIYEDRHRLNPECLTVPQGIDRGVFPADCPYVAGLEGYVPPVEDPDPEFVAELVAELEAEEFDGPVGPRAEEVGR